MNQSRSQSRSTSGEGVVVGSKHLNGTGERLLKNIKTPNRTEPREGGQERGGLFLMIMQMLFNGSRLSLVYCADSRLSRNFFSLVSAGNRIFFFSFFILFIFHFFMQGLTAVEIRDEDRGRNHLISPCTHTHTHIHTSARASAFTHIHTHFLLTNSCST